MANGRSILIVGQGSIGARHRDVLKELGHRVMTVSRRAGVGDFSSVPVALSSEPFDAIAICSETSEHVADLMVLKQNGFRGVTLIEKPTCVDVKDIDGLDTVGGAFVAYNLRFHPVVQKLRAAIARDESQLISAHLHVAQAMDTWRPGRARESSYSAFRGRGGGVLRDLSHELDLAMWLFGSVDCVAALGGRYSEQTVDSDDAWSILAECRKCPQVSISINGIDRAASRYIAVTTANQTYHADLVRGVLKAGLEEVSISVERNDSYRLMWQAFLDDGRTDVCTFQAGVSVMQLIAAIEEANQRRCWVRPDGVE
jgi:predicted dehydrogenase